METTALGVTENCGRVASIAGGRRSGSEGRPRRGQTEPLAALIAVSLVAGVFSLYAGVVSGFVSDLGSERELADATAQRVWEHLSEDGIYEDETEVRNAIPASALPQGHRVYVNVTFVGGGGEVPRNGGILFDADGSASRTSDVPPGADVFQRQIAIQRGDGDVKPGKLTVVVWDA